MKNALHINFFAGPGVGKSTLAMELTSLLKKKGIDADMTQEYAKELIYDESYELLNDQLHVAGEQHRRMKRLDRCVEVAVHDSPFVMGLNYCDANHIAHVEFNDFMIEQYNRYNNLNIFLERSALYGFFEGGRSQDIVEAKELDNKIKQFLEINDIQHIIIKQDKYTLDLIQETLRGKI